MTCQHFRSLWEEASKPVVLSPALTDHISTCSLCAKFTDEQRELQQNLRVLRDSLPEPSASLDGVVLSVYRQHQLKLSSKGPRNTRLFPTLAWCFGFATLLLVIAVPFLLNRRHPSVFAAPIRVVPSAPFVTKTSVIAAKQAHRRRTSPPAREKNASSTVALAAPAGALPAEFQSLLYCDELICPDRLEMIRVQLPSYVARFGPATGNAMVNADVLVGADGIARGIRIEQ